MASSVTDTDKKTVIVMLDSAQILRKRHTLAQRPVVPRRDWYSGFAARSVHPHRTDRPRVRLNHRHSTDFQPCGQHAVSIPILPHVRIPVASFRRSSFLVPPPISVSTLHQPLLPVQAAAIQRIEHVVVGARAAVRVARIQHVAHIQPGALGAARGRGRRRRGRGIACRRRLQVRIG